MPMEKMGKHMAQMKALEKMPMPESTTEIEIKTEPMDDMESCDMPEEEQAPTGEPDVKTAMDMLQKVIAMLSGKKEKAVSETESMMED